MQSNHNAYQFNQIENKCIHNIVVKVKSIFYKHVYSIEQTIKYHKYEAACNSLLKMDTNAHMSHIYPSQIKTQIYKHVQHPNSVE